MVASLALIVGTTLIVGPGQAYVCIEDALTAAKPGDRIEVLPGEYPKTALLVKTPRLTFAARGSVVLDGKGFDYSGVGATPRAIFQIAADGITIRGFELKGAHNASHNGAGIRIDAAKDVTVADCDIHGNDMGVMSNGRIGDATAGDCQAIERCHIHHNGDPGEPGQNHNLYLGGTSVTLRFCEIDHSITGHNLKSRAHLTHVEYCWLHDAHDREMDLVDAWDTQRPNSDAMVVGCVIQKDPEGEGNHGVIHFGRERGRRDGTLWLANDTIVTPFSTPAIALDGDEVSADLVNCVIKATTVAVGGPTKIRKDDISPAFRYVGKGRWVPTKDKFIGAGGEGL
jgi:hypothetical protein